MKPLDDKRKAMVKHSCDGHQATAQRKSCNSLEIKDGSSLSKVKESKEEKSKVSSSKEKDVVADVTTTLAWERYVDELAKEQQWIEIMTMRSGMGPAFVQRFDVRTKTLRRFVSNVEAFLKRLFKAAPIQIISSVLIRWPWDTGIYRE